MSDSPFREVGSVFPGEVTIVSVTPQTRVGEALKLMLETRFSQLPVIENDEVLGVFSLWSLAHQLALAPDLVVKDLEVGELMEQLPKVTVKDSVHSILNHLDRHDALLVHSPHGLQAILTPIDMLQYFYRIARPFILIQEIELALRHLIEACAPNDKLRECISRGVGKEFEKRGKPAPTTLNDMTFVHYQKIITCNDNWPMFEGLLGNNSQLVYAKLDRVREIRNTVFHFQTELSLLDHQHLATSRDWLLGKLKRTQAPGREKSHA